MKDPRYLIQEQMLSKLGINNTCKSELQKQPFLFILDGYDELPENQQKLNLYRINDLHSWVDSKVIVTCRTTHLKAGYHQVFTAQSEPPYSCNEVFVAPFNPAQVATYLGKFLNYYRARSQQDHVDYLKEWKRQPWEVGDYFAAFKHIEAFKTEEELT